MTPAKLVQIYMTTLEMYPSQMETEPVRNGRSRYRTLIQLPLLICRLTPHWKMLITIVEVLGATLSLGALQLTREYDGSTAIDKYAKVYSNLR